MLAITESFHKLKPFVTTAIDLKINEWVNRDWNDEQTIIDLANNPKCLSILIALKEAGILNEPLYEKVSTQTAQYRENFFAKIKTQTDQFRKLTNAFTDFTKDVQNLKQTNKFILFIEGEKKLIGNNPKRFFHLITRTGIAAVGAFGSFCFLTNPEIAATTSVPVLAVGMHELYKHAKPAIIEGYYHRIKGLAEKHFSKIIDAEKVNSLISILEKANITNGDEIEQHIKIFYEKTALSFINDNFKGI